jgi:endonuclease/exonuclease/phosphatase (EEP) superfamily protein YafD
VVCYLIFEDYSYLFIINSFIVYLFFLLPVIGLLVVVCKQPKAWIGVGLGVVIFIFIWGEYFLPKSIISKPAKSITIMTYNVLGHSPEAQASIDVIKSEDADVVMLQEVSPVLADAYRKQLIDIYPFQLLDPQPGVHGMGVLSKYPIELLDEELPMDWVGVPQILKLKWDGEELILINFHMNVVSTQTASTVTGYTKYRNSQAQALIDFAKQTDLPLVVAGDANSVFLSTAYEIITAELTDAWIEAGFGLGHTFPGSDIPGSSRPKFGSLYVPKWLVRIDYVFVSDDWGVASARVGEFDGLSDHRAVIAELFLLRDE